jgi:hypothetical protein
MTDAPANNTFIDQDRILNVYRESWGIAATACRTLGVPYQDFRSLIDGPLRKEAQIIRAEVNDFVLGCLLQKVLKEGDVEAMGVYLNLQQKKART